MKFLKKFVFVLLAVSRVINATLEEDREEYVRYGFERTYLPELFRLEDNPQIFVSYAWDRDARTDFVQRIGLDLKRVSESSLLDIVDNQPSTRIVDFVSKVPESKYVLLFGSEQYKAKWNKRSNNRSVLVDEADLIDHKKRSDINSVLGIQLNGATREAAFPEFMYQVVSIDACGRGYYDVFKDVLGTLWLKEGKSQERFDESWSIFRNYSEQVLRGERDAEVQSRSDYHERARTRLEEKINLVHVYQARLQEEEERREVARSADFLA